MSKSPFRKLRGISDQQLGQALTNHQYVLQGCVNFIAQYQKWRYVRWTWAALVTVALLYLVISA